MRSAVEERVRPYRAKRIILPVEELYTTQTIVVDGNIQFSQRKSGWSLYFLNCMHAQGSRFPDIRWYR